MSASTTGRIRSTHRAYWEPLGCSPSRGDERAIGRRAQRDVERVDEGDRPGARQPSHGRVGGDDALVLLARVAVVGAGRRDRVVGRGDGHDPGRRQPGEQCVEDPLDVRRVGFQGDPLHDVIDADQDGDELGPEAVERRQLVDGSGPPTCSR